MLIRRTIPAMAVTLAVFAAVQIFWGGWIRPHLIAPLHAVYSIAAVALADDWLSARQPAVPVGGGEGRESGSWAVTRSTRPGTPSASCRSPAGTRSTARPSRFPNCLTQQGIKLAVTYQPASRFWDFQLLETGIFLAAALLLGWLCVSRVSRRLA